MGSGCGCGVSKDVAFANSQIEEALKKFPPVAVSGAEEKRGLGACNDKFDEIKSFKWTFGGSGTVNCKRVQEVSMDKNTPKECVFEEVTGLFDCSYAVQKDGSVAIHIKKANVVHLFRVNYTKIVIDECNVCIITDGCNEPEFTIKKGEIICVDPCDIILNKGAETTFKHWDGGEGLLEGQAALDRFKQVRRKKPAVLNDI